MRKWEPEKQGKGKGGNKGQGKRERGKKVKGKKGMEREEEHRFINYKWGTTLFYKI